jgi:hypothetical protein
MYASATITSQETQRPSRGRLTAIIVGICYITAAAPAVLALYFYAPLLNSADYLRQGAAHSSEVTLGVLMEMIVVVSVIGTAVGLFPFLRKYQESVALAYLCFRFMEAVLITVGVVAMLSLLSLSQSFVAASAPDLTTYQTAGAALIALHAWTFLLGPNFMLGINTTLYSSLFLRSRLVPRWLATLGIIGAALVFLAALLELFGVIQQVSLWGGLLALPIAAYEMTLAVWLIARGFNPAALAVKSGQ